MNKQVNEIFREFADDTGSQFDLFVPEKVDIKQQVLDTTIDALRQKCGTTAIVKSSFKVDGGPMIDHAGLVGGHRVGQAYGTNN